MTKKLIYSFLFFVFFLHENSIAQSPQFFKYQAILRDLNGQAIVNSSVGVMINLFKDSCNGNNVYRESLFCTCLNPQAFFKLFQSKTFPFKFFDKNQTGPSPACRKRHWA